MLQGHFGQQTSAMRAKKLMGHIASQESTIPGLHENRRRKPVMIQAPVVGGRLWIDRDVRHVILVTAGERVILNLDRLRKYHWPALFFAPGEPEEIACRLTVFEPHWLSLFCAPSDPQLGSSIIGQHCFSRQVNLSKSPVNQLCLNLIGCHCFTRQVNLKNSPVDRSIKKGHQ